MNDAHLHLVVNHFPIIGTILGLGILIAGIVLKNKFYLLILYINRTNTKIKITIEPIVFQLIPSELSL